MKARINLLLAGMLLVFSCAIGKAQMIYSNSFSGGATTINGTAPTLANTLLGGIGTANWICTYTNNTPLPTNGTVLANGMIATNPGCALLPFSPQPGCVYFMTASLTLPSGMPNWVAMGFTQVATQTNNQNGIYSRFTDNPPGGYAWAGIRAGTVQGVYAGKGTANSVGNNTVIPAGSNTVTIVLNTVGVQWTFSAYLGGTISGTNVVGGTQLGTNFVFSTNPSIGFAGIGQTSFAGQSITGIQWNYWTLSVEQVTTSAVTNIYWVGPAASGTGDGSTSANAASFVNYSFWSGVQSQLQNANVTVNLNDGNYTAGTLNFTNMGDSAHRLTLQAVDLYQPVFNGNNGTLIYLIGSQNIKFYGLALSGPAAYWGIECLPNGLNPCRNVQISHCELINLTNILYGAVGLVNGARDIMVDNCTFTNLTASNGNHQHMIYSSHNIVNVVVTNCLFQDCYADYIRFRDNSEYGRVQNCTFNSTTSTSAWPFISVELYNVTNSDAAGDEFFGNYFQINNNSFNFNASGGVGPYSALHFSDDGYSPYTYDCAITSTQANQLSSGSASFKQSFLQTNFGITATNIKIFSNSYNSRVAYTTEYSYVWDNIQPNGGSEGPISLSGASDSSGTQLGPLPVLRNGNFDRQGLQLTAQTSSTPNECLFQAWFVNPKYGSVLSHPGFNGTSNALMLNVTQAQYVYQWITPPGLAWTMDFLFAMGNGSSNGAESKFKVDIFHDDILGSKVSVGVDSQGRFGIYNNAGGLVILPELGTVSFSVDVNGNNNYTDPGDTLNIYHIRIVGDYAASTPYVNIYTSDANNPALTHQSLANTYWVGSTPVSGISSPETLAFYNYTNAVLIDQITLTNGLGQQPPLITRASVANGKFILSGTNGFAGDPYVVQSSANLADWQSLVTNTFNTNGSFAFTNSAVLGTQQMFYRLQLQ